MLIKSKQGNANLGGAMGLFWGQAAGSIENAIQQAVDAAQATFAGATLEWLELVETRGGFDQGVLQYQVSVRIGYQLPE
ncbi:flavin-binding protein dodecin [Oxalobacteraceae bacterium GrIS 1.11]